MLSHDKDISVDKLDPSQLQVLITAVELKVAKANSDLHDELLYTNDPNEYFKSAQKTHESFELSK